MAKSGVTLLAVNVSQGSIGRRAHEDITYRETQENNIWDRIRVSITTIRNPLNDVVRMVNRPLLKIYV